MLINCNAKINIGLEIISKRVDNYHNINTIFHKISLNDELFIESSDNFDFQFNSGLNLPKVDNIAYKAAIAVKNRYNLVHLPVKITINKKIPAGAGLGGGSSDAAAVIKGLIKYFGLENNTQINREIALSLGADVPFFLNDLNSAIGNGLGEILSPFNMNLPYYIILVFPGIHISTPLAYSSLNRTNESIPATDYSKNIDVLMANPDKIKDIFFNHFEEPVFALHPELKQIKQALISSGAVYASMSGSGSTIYGFFTGLKLAESAGEQLGKYRTYIHIPA